MNSADKMRRLFDAAAVQTNAAPDDAVFDRIRTTYTKTVERNQPQRKPRAWRFIMRSPWAKLAVAAVILIACAIGLSLWKATGSGVTLANVLAQVQQATAYMYQMTMTVSGQFAGSLNIDQNVEATVLIAQDGCMKMTMNMTDPNSGRASRQEMYLLPQEKAMILLVPDRKRYVRMDLDETLLRKTRRETNDPGQMLEQILNCDYESMGQSRIDGVDVEGFRMTDPNYMAGIVSEPDVKIWVDVKTQLPVRSEISMDMGGMKMRGVVHDFQWNYPVDANTFTVVIPPDYEAMPGSGLKMPAANEESAIAGLKVCADLTGKYPAKLDFSTVSDLMKEHKEDSDVPFRQMMEENRKDMQALKQLIEETEKPPSEDDLQDANELIKKSDELLKRFEERQKARQEQTKTVKELLKDINEQVRKSVDRFMPVQGTVMFYMLLAQEQKAPAYHGDVVTPKDGDKVLMRWKMSDNQYRVIFGNLHAETVDAATLAELEKNLPK